MKKQGAFFLLGSILCIPLTSLANSNNSVAQLDQRSGVLFESLGSYDFSLELLQVKNKFNPNNIIFGGSSEFDAQRWQGDQIEQYPLGEVYQQGNGVYWTSATVDVMANVNPWVTTFASLQDSTIGRNDPNANYVYVPRAFLLMGNLAKAPVYSTLGINSIPFGAFSGSSNWDQALTTSYFDPAQAPQISVGFYKNGWSAVATGFQDQTYFQDHTAYNLSYSKDGQDFSYKLGGGYLNDLKMGNTASWSSWPNAVRRNLSSVNIGDLGAIVDVNAGARYHQFSVNAEYDKGQYKLNGNNHYPEAYAFIANYDKEIMGKNTIFGLTRSVTMHLKDVPTPLSGYDNLESTFAGLRDTWTVNVSRPILRNTALTLDLQRATTNWQQLNASYAHTYTATLDLTTYF